MEHLPEKTLEELEERHERVFQKQERARDVGVASRCHGPWIKD